MLEDGHILYVVNETQNTQHCKACNNDIHKAVRPVQRTEKQTSTVTILAWFYKQLRWHTAVKCKVLNCSVVSRVEFTQFQVGDTGIHVVFVLALNCGKMWPMQACLC